MVQGLPSLKCELCSCSVLGAWVSFWNLSKGLSTRVGLVLEYAKELLLFRVIEASKHQNMSGNGFWGLESEPLLLGQLFQGLVGPPPLQEGSTHMAPASPGSWAMSPGHATNQWEWWLGELISFLKQGASRNTATWEGSGYLENSIAGCLHPPPCWAVQIRCHKGPAVQALAPGGTALLWGVEMWSWRSFPAASLVTHWCLHSGTEAGLGMLCFYPMRRGLKARRILSCYDQRKKVVIFICLELYLTEAAHPVQFSSPQAASQHQWCVQAAAQSCEWLHKNTAHGHI